VHIDADDAIAGSAPGSFGRCDEALLSLVFHSLVKVTVAGV